MRIGIIGSGHIGATLARLWTKAGHQIAITNSRGPSSLASLVDELGPQVRATNVEEAGAFGEVVLLAIPFGKYSTLPSAQLANKVVIDAMNYYSQRDGRIDFDDRTSSELVAAHLPQSRLVKAFNTIHYQTLGTEGRSAAPVEDRLAIFVAGDDQEAKSVVAGLIQEIGFAPVDTGLLHDGGHKQQPGSPIYGRSIKSAEAEGQLSGLK